MFSHPAQTASHPPLGLTPPLPPPTTTTTISITTPCIPSPPPAHTLRTRSMAGYVLGLGDRHGGNVLLHTRSAEVLHIDLGIAFEQVGVRVRAERGGGGWRRCRVEEGRGGKAGAGRGGWVGGAARGATRWQQQHLSPPNPLFLQLLLPWQRALDGGGTPAPGAVSHVWYPALPQVPSVGLLHTIPVSPVYTLRHLSTHPTLTRPPPHPHHPHHLHSPTPTTTLTTPPARAASSTPRSASLSASRATWWTAWAPTAPRAPSGAAARRPSG